MDNTDLNLNEYDLSGFDLIEHKVNQLKNFRVWNRDFYIHQIAQDLYKTLKRLNYKVIDKKFLLTMFNTEKSYKIFKKIISILVGENKLKITKRQATTTQLKNNNLFSYGVYKNSILKEWVTQSPKSKIRVKREYDLIAYKVL